MPKRSMPVLKKIGIRSNREVEVIFNIVERAAALSMTIDT
jgi:hypothetical protein